MKKKNEGITLITLVITIVVLLILATITVYSGKNAIESGAVTKFTNEFRLMQLQANIWYETCKSNAEAKIRTKDGIEKLITDIGEPLDEQAKKVLAQLNRKEENYKLFTQEHLRDLQVEGISQDFIIDLQTRSVISYKGIEYKGTRHYTLDTLPDNVYNVSYEKENTGKPNFSYTISTLEQNKWKIAISNIQYTEGYIDKWYVKYKLEGEQNWQTSEDLNLIVTMPGNYQIKIANGAIESEEQMCIITYVNQPELLIGMTKVMYQKPTQTQAGKVIKQGETGFEENNWYQYGVTSDTKRWANSITQDGSLWVWIPRYAYRIDSENKIVDVKFLIGTTNQYYNTETKQKENLPQGYTVHPCFQNGTTTGYKNGEWDKELTGIWVAKFEAGLPAETTAPKATVEGMSDSYYPVFQGQKPSYNFINVSQSYLLSKSLTTSGNPYGLTSNSADSHLIKNSEWGAVAYLSYSQYGKTGGNYQTEKEVFINNVTYAKSATTSQENSIRNQGIYSITGYAGSSASEEENIVTDIHLTDVVTDGVKKSYAWHTVEGGEASTTGTIYGIYDMSGGVAEYTSSYSKMQRDATILEHLKNYGSAFVFQESSDTQFVGNTSYVMEYPEYTAGGLKTTLTQLGRYGDGYVETWGWLGDGTNNDASGPFVARGGTWSDTLMAGVFAFDDAVGITYGELVGFRTVLVEK